MTRLSVAFTATLMLVVSSLGFTQGIARVRFILRNITVTGEANEPERPAKTVQRTQFLVFTLGGGAAPWTVSSDNNVVKVEQTAPNVFKITPNDLGTSVIAVTDRTGGGKYVDIRVIEDRYGADALVFRNDNGMGVVNGPTVPTTFTIQVGQKVTAIRTYHYNNGQGKPGGTIMLRHADGRQYGPWTTTVESKFYWVAKPNASIAPGTYTIVDSDPASWSRNQQSGNAGFAIMNGMPRLLN